MVVHASGKNKLSIAMIVKNEESNISNCLDSIAPIADQIVILDTGSTDKTLEIIGKHKTEPFVIEVKWVDDFASARNLSLKFCSNDWIMWFDADDILPPESVPLINKIKTFELTSFYYFRIINTIDGLPIGSNFLQCRMFPNSNDIYFENKVHESATASCVRAALTAYNDNNIVIHHTGYDNKQAKINKSNRNIGLIKSIEGYSKSPYWLSHLGICYEMKGDFRSAHSYYYQSLDYGKSADIYKKLGNTKLHLKEYPEAEKYYKLGLKCDDLHMETNYHLAKIYEFTEQWGKAINQYETVLTLPEQISIAVNQFHQCRLYSFHYLLRIYTAFEMNQKAVELIMKMNSLYPKHKAHDD